MNRAQKMAWMFVVTISSALALSGLAVVVLYFIIGMPKALAGIGFIGIAGLAGLAPLIFKKDKGKVTCDERDKLINQRASLASFGLVLLVRGTGVHDSVLHSWPNSNNFSHVAAYDIWGSRYCCVFRAFRGNFGSVWLEEQRK